MMIFGISAAVLVIAAVGLIMLRARRFPADPTVDLSAHRLYKRQLEEVDDLVQRGLIAVEERQTAFSEAARRLLRNAPTLKPAQESRYNRVFVALTGAAASLGALAVYLVAGSPGLQDQPFAERLAAWRAMDPRELDPPSMAAVLGSLARQNPGDPKLQLFLGKSRLAAGDMPGAAEAFRAAARLAPSSPEPLVLLGEALTRADGKVTGDAQTAFRRALSLDPSNLSAQFFLGQAAVDAGDPDAGVAAWRRLLASLPADDPRRAYLDEQIKMAATGKPSRAPESAMIRGMVERQAERLRQSPDDPAGWARLVRSYGVLGDLEARSTALASARLALKDDPAGLAIVEAEAAGTPTPRP